MEVLNHSSFSALIGPIEVEWEPSPVFHTVVRADCANTMGRVHGGFLAALIDIAAGQGVKRILNDGRSLVTATTHTQNITSARVGDRLRAAVELERSTSALVFASCRVSSDDRLVAIASVVFSARPTETA